MNIDPNEAINFMIKNSEAYANAKAQVVYLTEYRKTVKAIGFQRSLKNTMAEKEADAYTTVEYKTCVEGLREAVAEAERLRWMLVAAQARVDVYRTQEASNRNIDRNTQ
jgi:predicted transposase YbfD/YdcC